MPKMTMKDGILSFEDKVPVKIDYVCECGAEATITMELPENVTFNSEISISSLVCSTCGNGVKLPRSSYTVIDGKLVDIGAEKTE